MPTRTASRATMYGALFADTVLDDLNDPEAAVEALTAAFHNAWEIAHARVITSHDRWNGDDAEIHAHLTVHPAF